MDQHHVLPHVSLLDCFMHTWAAAQAYNQNLDLLSIVDLNSAGSMDGASSFLCLIDTCSDHQYLSLHRTNKRSYCYYLS